MKFTVKVENGCIAEIRFRAKGCVPAMACGSALTELVLGKTLEEAARVHHEQLLEAIGDLPQASTHAIHLALDTLRVALKQIKT